MAATKWCRAGAFWTLLAMGSLLSACAVPGPMSGAKCFPDEGLGDVARERVAAACDVTPPTETLLVTILPHPRPADSQPRNVCNPLFVMRTRPGLEHPVVNLSVTVDDRQKVAEIVELRRYSLRRSLANGFVLGEARPIEKACGEIALRVDEVVCRASHRDDLGTAVPCPRVRFEGTDLFGSFSASSS